MILYTTGQRVTHDNKKWVITGFKEENGSTISLLKRGPYTKEVDETEVSK